MLLYILLILGQAFASQKQADQIYYCVDKMARSESVKSGSSKFTVREVAESCRDEIGATQILVREAKITEGTTHYLKLAWHVKGKESYRHYAFNIPNTKLCNETQGAVKGFALNLRDILNNTKNSVSYNSCAEHEGDEQIFGFKKNGKICERTCPKGSVLQGQRVSAIHNLHGYTLSHAADISVHNSMEEMLLGTECVSCPKNNSAKYIRYAETHEKDNFCYDSDGCPEGFEHVPGLHGESYSPSFPSINDPKKSCRQICSGEFKRNPDGECALDKNQQCQFAKARQARTQKWLSEFLKIAESEKVGTCDMPLIRDLAREMVFEVEKTLKLQVDNYCLNKKLAQNDMTRMMHSSRSTLTKAFDERYPDSYKCILNSKNKDTNFNSEIYRLFNEDLLEEPSPSRDFIY